MSYTASSSNGINARYSWNFDDGSAQTAYSTSPAVTHTFATPGIYYVTRHGDRRFHRGADSDGGADHLPRSHRQSSGELEQHRLRAALRQ